MQSAIRNPRLEFEKVHNVIITLLGFCVALYSLQSTFTRISSFEKIAGTSLRTEKYKEANKIHLWTHQSEKSFVNIVIHSLWSLFYVVFVCLSLCCFGIKLHMHFYGLLFHGAWCLPQSLWSLHLSPGRGVTALQRWPWCEVPRLDSQSGSASP